MAGRRRVKPPSHKITIYIPLELMDAFEKYVYEKRTTMTDTITELIRELLKREGYLNEKLDEGK